MSFSPIAPLQPASDRYRHDRTDTSRRDSPAVSKVKGLVLERISLPGRGSALLPSATAPRVIIDFLSEMAIPALEEAGRQAIDFSHGSKVSRRTKLRKSASGKSVPIGLKRYEEGWMNALNALMQFLFSLPGFTDLLFFAPRSFEPVQDFIDQYLLDQHENRAVSTANTQSLLGCLMRKLPHHLFHKAAKANLYEIFYGLIQALFPSLRPSPLNAYFSDSIALHPEWHLIWEVESGIPLQEAIERKWEGRPPELLVAVKGVDASSCNLIKKQFCTPSEWLCYDLDAFIELRPDESEANFVTYLKIDGGWYQCDDDRITHLRSNCLNVPLCRSVLLHYKRIEFGRPGWS